MSKYSNDMWFEYNKKTSEPPMSDAKGMCLFFWFELEKTYKTKYGKSTPDPESFFKSSDCWNFEKYRSHLEEIGFDTSEAYKTFTEKRSAALAKNQESSIKAAKFFDFFLTELFISKEQIDEYIDESSIYHLLSIAAENAATTKARIKAKKKLERDPKQQTKDSVFQYWLRWQKDKTLYKSQADFVRDIFRIFGTDSDLDDKEQLKSTDVIAGWCRKWKREREITDPAS